MNYEQLCCKSVFKTIWPKGMDIYLIKKGLRMLYQFTISHFNIRDTEHIIFQLQINQDDRATIFIAFQPNRSRPLITSL